MALRVQDRKKVLSIGTLQGQDQFLAARGPFNMFSHFCFVLLFIFPIVILLLLISTRKIVLLFVFLFSPEDVSTSLYFPFYHHGEQNKERLLTNIYFNSFGATLFYTYDPYTLYQRL